MQQIKITRDVIEINSFVAALRERVEAYLLRPFGLILAECETDEERGRLCWREWRVGQSEGYMETYDALQLGVIETRGGLYEHAIWSGRELRIHANPETGEVRVLRLHGSAWRALAAYPLICPVNDWTAWAPVYIGTTAEGLWFYLSCMWPSAHLECPRSLEELAAIVQRRGGYKVLVVIAGRVVEEVAGSPAGPLAAETAIAALRRHLRA